MLKLCSKCAQSTLQLAGPLYLAPIQIGPFLLRVRERLKRHGDARARGNRVPRVHRLCLVAGDLHGAAARHIEILAALNEAPAKIMEEATLDARLATRRSPGTAQSLRKRSTCIVKNVLDADAPLQLDSGRARALLSNDPGQCLALGEWKLSRLAVLRIGQENESGSPINVLPAKAEGAGLKEVI